MQHGHVFVFFCVCLIRIKEKERKNKMTINTVDLECIEPNVLVMHCAKCYSFFFYCHFYLPEICLSDYFILLHNF